MWKLAAVFVVFAAVVLFVLSKGGDIDMSGEKHGSEAAQTTASGKNGEPSSTDEPAKMGEPAKKH